MYVKTCEMNMDKLKGVQYVGPSERTFGTLFEVSRSHDQGEIEIQM